MKGDSGDGANGGKGVGRGSANVGAVFGKSMVTIGDSSIDTNSASIGDLSSGTGSASIDDSSSVTGSALTT